MIRLLLVEDDPADAERTVSALRSAGFSCASERVATEHDFRAALSRAPDLILSEVFLPKFDGRVALSIVKAVRPTTPFIFLSGAAGQEKGAEEALQNGATAYLNKANPEALARAVRAAIQPQSTALRRSSDRVELPGEGREPGESASYLLERQAILERALGQEDKDSLSSIFSRNPPIPVALVMIQEPAARERYLKLLHTADIDTELAADATDATVQLTARVHAVLFTDQLELIRAVRQLSAGAATHVVFVAPEDANAASQALQAGATDVMSAKGRGEQFWARLTMVRRIVSLTSSLQSAVTDNRILSTIDELTRCGNRRYFEQQFPREVARATRLRRPLALLMCDIDYFKAINDRYGHQVGDEVLREIGARLAQGLRLGEDWVARVGGEEFAIVLPEANRFKAVAVAERLRKRVNSKVFATSAGPLAVTTSLGVCGVQPPLPDRFDLRELMMAAADAALYQSKRDGRDRVTEADSLDNIKLLSAPLVQ